MISIFFAYSHTDAELRDELEKHLASLKREGEISAWHDRRISPGKEWKGQIDAALEIANIILLLVSADFIDSDYCYDVECARALARHKEGSARAIPVILRSCDWKHTPLGALLALPTDGKPVTKHPSRDDAFVDIVLGVRRVVEELTGGAPAQALEQPKPGPAVIGGEGARPLRSSNLRVKRVFTERDRHRFLEETFEYLAIFFENSLTELSRRYDDLEGTVKRIDAVQFTATLYRAGAQIGHCRIAIGQQHAFGSDSITYSEDPRGGGISESLSVKDDGHALALMALFGSTWGGDREKSLTQEGAAELLWSRFIDRLQR